MGEEARDDIDQMQPALKFNLATFGTGKIETNELGQRVVAVVETRRGKF